ncbi:MAG: GTPase HflX [Victivallales bacterium]|nr:GTPase HflX [Victivallales bacterium]
MARESAIHTVKEDPRKVEYAFLVGVQFPEQSAEESEELLAELAELTDTLGVAVVGRSVVRIRKPQARYLVGEGKADDVLDQAREAGADVVIFDDYLTPSQQRNWEARAELAVIDRQEVILDIFAQRAHTSEASLQVELARANYSLPRLRRQWTHLHRQGGGAGGAGGAATRGEGEQQIEVDSRLVRRRIARLKTQLAQVQKHRRTQRAKRLRRPVPVAAIVGYTNAGKSSLLNTMTNANVLTEDKLFATLDPTVRRVELPNKQPLLLADTVGFIRKLPHLLVEAFKSTLEETALADLLVEVVDVTSRSIEEEQTTTQEVLAGLGAGEKPSITVFNKIDLIEDDLVIRRLRRRHPDALFVSARTGEGLDLLAARLAESVAGSMQQVELLVPHSRYDLMARLHSAATVLREQYEDDGIHVTANVPPDLHAAVAEFLSPSPADGIDRSAPPC